MSVPPRPSSRRAFPFRFLACVCLGAPIAGAAAAGVRPDVPTAVSPEAASTVSAMPARLTANVSDRDGDSLTVTFYGRAVTSAGPDFTLIEIPDTQYYTSSLKGGNPGIFRSQTQWIAANRVLRNIAYVAHVGDIVEHEDNNGNPSEWIAADYCMKPLEDPDATLLPQGIPFGISPGNHDIAPTGAVMFYDSYFGASRFSGRAYYGGHYGNDNANWFNLFSASGLDFIVIGMKLMWSQDPKPLHWADSLLSAYPNRRAIIVSHYLLDPGPPVTFGPQGQSIYDGLKSHANLILMICGHYVNDARRSDTYNGHTVHTVMSNYQNWSNGGAGWLRIMEFSPIHNQIRMRTYSPWLGQFRVQPDSATQFTLSCDLSGGDTGFRPIATIRRAASGSTPSILWTGLHRGKKYEWYVTASDGSGATAGPVSQFTLKDDFPPVVSVGAPNGGESLLAGQWTDLRWSATDEAAGVSDVDVLLSRGGLSGPWEILTQGWPNTGAFHWRVTGPATTNAYFGLMARDSFYNFAVDASDHSFQIVAATAVGEGPAGTVTLEPVAPNPTRGPGHIAVVLPGPGLIRLAILDVAGREVAVLADGFQPAGRHDFSWDGSGHAGSAPPGIYVARLESSGLVLTQKFVVAR